MSAGSSSSQLLLPSSLPDLILVIISLPAFTAYEYRGRFGLVDVLLTITFLAFTSERRSRTISKWAFQTSKRTPDRCRRDASSAVSSLGPLFVFSRHPNYFFELAQWWILFLMAWRGCTLTRSSGP